MKIIRDISLFIYLLFLISTNINAGRSDTYLSKLHTTLVSKFKMLEKVSKCKLFITSGWRSEEHNKVVHGVLNSLHLVGQAIDVFPLRCSVTLSQLGLLATKWFSGVIVYSSHLHIDIGQRKYHYLGK